MVVIDHRLYVSHRVPGWFHHRTTHGHPSEPMVEVIKYARHVSKENHHRSRNEPNVFMRTTLASHKTCMKPSANEASIVNSKSEQRNHK
ncbi:hypothetical protein [Marinococcus halophilus]|uniref:hypothetical protein n=1 Tax=Marinococcus halophilus TaxID=1371 RepID=UPI00117CA121|nr:hypothetical protein [Marinococcus halophilus]